LVQPVLFAYYFTSATFETFFDGVIKISFAFMQCDYSFSSSMVTAIIRFLSTTDIKVNDAYKITKNAH
jgi:hypothetical protein